jgi:hypothetical protein
MSQLDHEKQEKIKLEEMLSDLNNKLMQGGDLLRKE